MPSEEPGGAGYKYHSLNPGSTRNRRLHGGQREAEGRALARFRFDPDAASMAVYDFLADRQTHAVAGTLGARMEAAKDTEHLLGVLRLDANTVVADREHPILLAPFRGDMNQGRFVPAVLYGVDDQVLKQTRELHRITRLFQ